MRLFRDETKPSKHLFGPSGQIDVLYASDTSKVGGRLYVSLELSFLEIKVGVRSRFFDRIMRSIFFFFSTSRGPLFFILDFVDAFCCLCLLARGTSYLPEEPKAVFPTGLCFHPEIA